ncbi:MAG: glutaconate CoA-transferase, partial [Candidatus Tectomicrobia bacterium]|nr:glutaconate CoA-transferase [Candidatus Tectomicrobia bacterium]
MLRRFDDLLATTFAVPQNEGSDKVMPLTEAIRRHVKPGMSLHITETTGAAVCQLLREFHGTTPGFTLMMIGVGGYSMFLVHAGLVKKIITSLCVGGGRTPSFNPIIQKVFRDSSVEIENWSLLSIPQRFMAGALGVPFMPTRSILGSSMAQENKDSFKVIDDPFGSGRQASLVKALNPDISLAHACAADPYGNAILPQSGGTGHGPWGLFASTKGVILTVEKLVSTDFIREHSHLVRLPGHLVSSVSVVPFGAHPGALIRRGIRGFETYGEDDDFVDRQAEALEKPE